MQLDDDIGGRERFDQLTAGEFGREPLEAFVCLGCGRIFVGAPHVHVLFLDADDLASRMSYNVPEGARCPTCGTVIQGKGQRSREASTAELLDSRWRWLIESE
jgi:DNA-directed RNA polymerase subunit RPC12/RpoP